MTNVVAFIPARSGSISSAIESDIFSAEHNLALLCQTHS